MCHDETCLDNKRVILEIGFSNTSNCEADKTFLEITLNRLSFERSRAGSRSNAFSDFHYEQRTLQYDMREIEEECPLVQGGSSLYETTRNNII